MRRFDTVLANGESTVWCMPLVTITTPPVVSRSREQPIPSLTTHSMHPLPTYTHTHTGLCSWSTHSCAGNESVECKAGHLI